MEYLERCGVVNCDIKLPNVFVTPSGHLALADFDLAVPDVRPAMEAQQCEYKDVRIDVGCGGTSTYKAPERFSSSNARCIVTPRADTWSLGIVLLEFALQINTSYFLERFPRLFGSMDSDQAMAVVFKEFFWKLSLEESRNATGTAKLGDPLVYTFIGKLLDPDSKTRITIQEAKQHPIFKGLDWDAIRSGANEPPLFKQGCKPSSPSITLGAPAVPPNDAPMKRLQRNGMLSFSDFGSDWIAPGPDMPEVLCLDHGPLPPKFQVTYSECSPPDAPAVNSDGGRATVGTTPATSPQLW
ncbi:kinase-like protein [Peniophora sp. CONT]|nr:kinase-like protein [Peniophora sp. CONT]